MSKGQYTQEIFCGQVDLPFGYLTLDYGKQNQTTISFTSTGLNTNGVWFVPISDTRYKETDSVMQSYQSGSATQMTNWMY